MAFISEEQKSIGIQNWTDFMPFNMQQLYNTKFYAFQTIKTNLDNWLVYLTLLLLNIRLP